MAESTRLLYVADPLCSWCYGFAPVLDAVRPELPSGLLRLVLGGLAPDSAEPMDEAMRSYVRSAWQAVEARTGAVFDHSLWERTTPRRSTWPACRGCLAAGLQVEGGKERFYRAVQRAHYREARDATDPELLPVLAGELGLDVARFVEDMDGPRVLALFERDMHLALSLEAHGFPCLIRLDPGGGSVLARGYLDEPELRRLLAAQGWLEAA